MLIYIKKIGYKGIKNGARKGEIGLQDNERAFLEGYIFKMEE